MKSAITRLGLSRFGNDLLTAIERVPLNRPGARVVSILESEQGEGASEVISEIFESAVRIGRRTVLINLDADKPRLFENLPAPARSLEKILQEKNEESTAVPGDGALVISSSSTQPELAMEFAATQATALVDRCKLQYQIILLHAPPLIGSNIAELAAHLSDRTYLTVRQERTTQMQAQRSVARLRHAGIDVGGLVYTGRRLRIPEILYRNFFGSGT